MKSGVFLLFLGVMLGSLASIGALRYSGFLRVVEPAVPALEVNGVAVSQEFFNSRLRAYAGQDVLAQLVQQLLIEGAANKFGIKLDADEQRDLKASIRQVADNSDASEYLESERRTQLLIRKLAMREVPESEVRRVFDLFQEELRRFEISVIVVLTESEARAILKKLEEGVVSFEDLVRVYSLDPSNGGKMGFLTKAALRSKLGVSATNTILKMKPNTVAGPMYCSQGLMVVKLGRVLTTFEELRDYVVDIFVNARRTALSHELMQDAKIRSPFLDQSVTHGLSDPGTPSSPVPPAIPGKLMLDAPDKSTGPRSKTLPKPEKSSSQVRDLPSPKVSIP